MATVTNPTPSLLFSTFQRLHSIMLISTGLFAVCLLLSPANTMQHQLHTNLTLSTTSTNVVVEGNKTTQLNRQKDRDNDHAQGNIVHGDKVSNHKRQSTTQMPLKYWAHIVRQSKGQSSSMAMGRRDNTAAAVKNNTITNTHSSSKPTTIRPDNKSTKDLGWKKTTPLNSENTLGMSMNSYNLGQNKNGRQNMILKSGESLNRNTTKHHHVFKRSSPNLSTAFDLAKNTSNGGMGGDEQRQAEIGAQKSQNSSTPSSKQTLFLSMGVRNEGHSVRVDWTIKSPTTIDDDLMCGFVVSYKMDGRENYDSSRLDKGVRTFFLHSLHEDKHYSICIRVVSQQNRSLDLRDTQNRPIDELCLGWSKHSMKMVMGVIAGLIFLLPCLVIVVWVVYKDRQITASQCRDDDDDDEACSCTHTEQLKEIDEKPYGNTEETLQHEKKRKCSENIEVHENGVHILEDEVKFVVDHSGNKFEEGEPSCGHGDSKHECSDHNVIANQQISRCCNGETGGEIGTVNKGFQKDSSNYQSDVRNDDK